MWKYFWDWLATLPSGSASFVGTVTGSSLGLVALLIGALFNAHLNRRRDDRLRDADRVVVAAALHAELVAIHDGLLGNVQHLIDNVPDPVGGFLVPEPSIRLLPEVMSKTGLLRPDAITKVMDAYAVAAQYFDRLSLIGGKIRTDLSSRFLYLDAQHAQFVIEYNQIRAKTVKEAIDVLAPYLK